MSNLRLNTILTMDGTGFYSGLSRARAAVNQFAGGALGGIKGQIAAAFGAGAITMFNRKTMEYADNIDELARSLGVMPDKLQEWEYAGKLAGVPLEKMVQFMRQLNTYAQTGAGAKFLQSMGIDPKQNIQGLFESVWSKAGKMGSGEGNAFLREVGGRGDPKMFGMMQEDLASLGMRAREAGQIIESDTIAKLANLNDQLSLVSKMLMTEFAPALLNVAKVALQAFGQIKGASSFWGSATMNVSAKDMWKDLIYSFNPFVGSGKGNVLKKIKENIEGGAPSAAFDAELKNIDNMLAALAGHPYGTGAGNSGPMDGNPDKKHGGLKLGGGDQLLKVGNFLGQGRYAMDSIAQQSLNVQKEHKTISKEMLLQLRLIAAQTAKDVIGVP